MLLAAHDGSTLDVQASDECLGHLDWSTKIPGGRLSLWSRCISDADSGRKRIYVAVNS